MAERKVEPLKIVEELLNLKPFVMGASPVMATVDSLNRIEEAMRLGAICIRQLHDENAELIKHIETCSTFENQQIATENADLRKLVEAMSRRHALSSMVEYEATWPELNSLSSTIRELKGKLGL